MLEKVNLAGDGDWLDIRKKEEEGSKVTSGLGNWVHPLKWETQGKKKVFLFGYIYFKVPALCPNKYIQPETHGKCLDWRKKNGKLSTNLW